MKIVFIDFFLYYFISYLSKKATSKIIKRQGKEISQENNKCLLSKKVFITSQHRTLLI